MKHFAEARQGAIAAISDPSFRDTIDKACLIFDLQGKCRVLLRAAEGEDIEVVEKRVKDALATAAEDYWDGETWVDRPKLSPSKKSLHEKVWAEAVPTPPGQERIFVLDRRLSKDPWLNAPFEPPWPLNLSTPPILSFFSFKGGVGRTTSVMAVAVNAARSGRRVVVVDFDLEAPGVGSTLAGVGGTVSSLGVVDFLLEYPVLRDGLDVTEFCHECVTPGIVGDGPPIVVVPAGTIDSSYIEKLARINYEYLYESAHERDPSKSPLHAFFKMIRQHYKPDMILVDSRAGFHDLGGLSLSGIAHRHVLFGLSGDQSWQGIRVAVEHLGGDEVRAGRKQRDCTLVQAMAPPPGAVREAVLHEFKEKAFEVFSDAYYDDTDNENPEWPVPDMESIESPHYPQVLTWDNRVFGVREVASIANILCEGEFRTLAATLLEQVGRGS